jgi:hypothetical protein
MAIVVVVGSDQEPVGRSQSLDEFLLGHSLYHWGGGLGHRRGYQGKTCQESKTDSKNQRSTHETPSLSGVKKALPFIKHLCNPKVSVQSCAIAVHSGISGIASAGSPPDVRTPRNSAPLTGLK